MTKKSRDSTIFQMKQLLAMLVMVFFLIGSMPVFVIAESVDTPDSQLPDVTGLSTEDALQVLQPELPIQPTRQVMIDPISPTEEPPSEIDSGNNELLEQTPQEPIIIEENTQTPQNNPEEELSIEEQKELVKQRSIVVSEIIERVSTQDIANNLTITLNNPVNDDNLTGDFNFTISNADALVNCSFIANWSGTSQIEPITGPNFNLGNGTYLAFSESLDGNTTPGEIYEWAITCMNTNNISDNKTSITETFTYQFISDPIIINLVEPNNNENVTGMDNLTFNLSADPMVNYSCDIIINGTIKNNSGNITGNATYSILVSNLNITINDTYNWLVNCSDSEFPTEWNISENRTFNFYEIPAPEHTWIDNIQTTNMSNVTPSTPLEVNFSTYANTGEILEAGFIIFRADNNQSVFEYNKQMMPNTTNYNVSGSWSGDLILHNQTVLLYQPGMQGSNWTIIYLPGYIGVDEFELEFNQTFNPQTFTLIGGENFTNDTYHLASNLSGLTFTPLVDQLSGNETNLTGVLIDNFNLSQQIQNNSQYTLLLRMEENESGVYSEISGGIGAITVIDNNILPPEGNTPLQITLNGPENNNTWDGTNDFQFTITYDSNVNCTLNLANSTWSDNKESNNIGTGSQTINYNYGTLLNNSGYLWNISCIDVANSSISNISENRNFTYITLGEPTPSGDNSVNYTPLWSNRQNATFFPAAKNMFDFSGAPYVVRGPGCKMEEFGGMSYYSNASMGANCYNNNMGEGANESKVFIPLDMGAVWVDQAEGYLAWHISGPGLMNNSISYCSGETNNVAFVFEFNSDGNTSTGCQGSSELGEGCYHGADYQIWFFPDDNSSLFAYYNGSQASADGQPAGVGNCSNNPGATCYVADPTVDVQFFINCSPNYNNTYFNVVNEGLNVIINKSVLPQPVKLNFETNSFNMSQATANPIDMLTDQGVDPFIFMGPGAGAGSDCFQYDNNQSGCDNAPECTWTSFGGGNGLCDPDFNSFSEGEACFTYNTMSACEGSDLGYCQWLTNVQTPQGLQDLCVEQFMPAEFSGGDCDSDCFSCFTQTQCQNSDANGGSDYGGCEWYNDSFNPQGWCDIKGLKFGCEETFRDCFDSTSCTNSGWHWNTTYNLCQKQEGAEMCFNGIDDDGDGNIDCEDFDCEDLKFCGAGIDTLTGDFAGLDPAMAMDMYISSGLGGIIYLGEDSNNDSPSPSTEILEMGVGVGPRSIGMGLMMENLSDLVACGGGVSDRKTIFAIDTDRNESTGCQITLDGINETGYEYIVKYGNYSSLNESGQSLVLLACKAGLWVPKDAAIAPITSGSEMNPTPTECGDEVKGFMAIAVMVEKAAIGNPTSGIRFSGIILNGSWDNLDNLQSYDTFLDRYYTPGSIDSAPVDCFQEPTKCGSEFMIVGEGKFMPFEDCIMPGDEDLDGEENCADSDCANMPQCQNDPNKYNISNDKTAPKITLKTVESFHDVAFVKWTTNEPTNGTIEFYGSDNTCVQLNESIFDSGDVGTFDDYRAWHHAPLDDFSLGHFLDASTTYYYKILVYDKAGNKGISKCLNFTTKSQAQNISMMFNFTPQGGNSSDFLGNLSIEFNGVPQQIGGVIQDEDQKDVNITFSNPNADPDKKWSIELVGADLYQAVDLDFSDMFLANNTGDYGEAIGMPNFGWTEISQTLGVDYIILQIPDDSGSLFHCSDNGTSCVEVTNEEGVQLLELGTGWSLWKVPTSLGFSTYSANGDSYSLTFINLGAIQQNANTSVNTTYLVNITNDDNTTRTYNISITPEELNWWIDPSQSVLASNASETINITVNSDIEGEFYFNMTVVLADNASVSFNSYDDFSTEFLLNTTAAAPGEESGVINLTSCQTIDQNNSEYVLINNINDSNWWGSGAWTCFEVIAHNVTLNCSGFAISNGTGANDPAFEITGSNVTITDCIIDNVNVAIRARNTADITIMTSDVTNYNHSEGILFENVSGGVIDDIVIDANNEDKNGIVIIDSQDITVQNSEFNNVNTSSYINASLFLGYDNQPSYNITVRNNLFNQSNVGLRMNNASLSTIYSNNFVDAHGRDVMVEYGSMGNTFYNNNFTSNFSVQDNVVGNMWNNSIRGNHWVEYDGVNDYDEGDTCVDGNSDGFCDSMYTLDGSAGAIDYMPIAYGTGVGENGSNVTWFSNINVTNQNNVSAQNTLNVNFTATATTGGIMETGFYIFLADNNMSIFNSVWNYGDFGPTEDNFSSQWNGDAILHNNSQPLNFYYGSGGEGWNQYILQGYIGNDEFELYYNYTHQTKVLNLTRGYNISGDANLTTVELEPLYFISEGLNATDSTWFNLSPILISNLNLDVKVLTPYNFTIGLYAMDNTTEEEYLEFSEGLGTINVIEEQTPGEEGSYDDGFDEWQSRIVSPFILKGTPKLINFSLERNAQNSCLDSVSIVIPQNFTYLGQNTSSMDPSNYTVSVIAADEIEWNATGEGIMCDQGTYYLGLYLDSTDNYELSDFEVIGFANGTEYPVNLSMYTTTSFSYEGVVYDATGQPLEGVNASLSARSFQQNGDVSLGSFSALTNSTGQFNITMVPGLNMSIDNESSYGTAGDIFYQLSVVKYNDSNNHYGMFVGPSMPDLPETETRSPNGLGNPTVILKDAVTFHIQVEGYDYKAGPINQSLCDQNGCADEAFNWTNVEFNYGLKDSVLGYSVAEDFTNSDVESYISAPLYRDYSLMLYPESSFPLYVDFANISGNCNTTGVNISQTGVEATCTIQNGTYFVDVIVSAQTNMTTFTGSVDNTGLDSFFILPYTLGAGNMIFNHNILPKNLGNMMRWPSDPEYNDLFNTTTGEFNITVPATQTHSELLMVAYVEKNGTYYRDSFILETEGLNLAVIEHNFTLAELINGSEYNISSNDISQDWNETLSVSTTGIDFNFVYNGTVLSSESSFIEMRISEDGTNFLYMVDATDGGFSLPLEAGQGIDKMTIYSQSYAPISAPISAAILNGSTNNSKFNCNNGECNITFSRFDTFDPKTGESLNNVFIDFYKSNETCDVPNPGIECSLMNGTGKESFSPLKAILLGDISMRITMGNLSVHYANTDLLASGPPDAAFSENFTGEDLSAAWTFGSQGPEIYDEILISMPYAQSIGTDLINMSIPLLYDSEFNVFWNISTDNISALVGTDYDDYLNNSFEGYFNGTGVLCNTTDENLTSGICYQDSTNYKVWIKIPHFSGVGPRISVIQSQESGSNITATYPQYYNGTSWNFLANLTYGEPVEQLRVNCTNLDNQSAVANASFSLVNLNGSDDNITTTNATSNSSEWFILDVADFNVSDSGTWSLTATCMLDNGSTDSVNPTTDIAWGTLGVSLTDYPTDVQRYEMFTVNASITCTGGECQDVNLYLDPYKLEENTGRTLASTIVAQKTTGVLSQTQLDKVQEQISEQGATYVIVKLKDKPEGRLATQSTFSETTQQLDIVKEYEASNLVKVRVDAAGLEELLANDQVEAVQVAERNVHALLDTAVPIIGGDDVWAHQIDGVNVTGEGVGVCIIDTGINYSHPDFGAAAIPNSKVVATKCFVDDAIWNGTDWVPDTGDGDQGWCPNGLDVGRDAYDDYGHGSHVAGIISSQDTTYKGVAPDANLIVVKALAYDGAGWNTDIIDGIDWCVAHKDDYGIKIISMSLGGGGYSDVSSCETANAGYTTSIDAAVANNITVLIASGNAQDQGQYNKVAAPACVGSAISIGATDDNDNMAYFAQAGPLLDFVAPGYPVTATDYDGTHVAMSGTSMATPIAAGFAALMTQYKFLEEGKTMNSSEMYQVFGNNSVEVDDTSNSGYNYSRINIANASNVQGFSVNGETVLSLGKGVIPVNNTGATPFYTTSPNPYNDSTAMLGSMEDGESQNFTWTVNATGDYGSYEFFAFANSYTDDYIESSHTNIAISDSTTPIVTLIKPTQEEMMSTNVSAMNFTVTDSLDTTVTCNLYIDDSLVEIDTFTADGSTNTFGNYQFSNDYFEWYVTCQDDYENEGTSSTWNFTVDNTAPQYSSLSASPSGIVDVPTNVTISANWSDNNLQNISLYFANNDSLITTQNSSGGVVSFNFVASVNYAEENLTFYMIGRDLINSQTTANTSYVYVRAAPYITNPISDLTLAEDGYNGSVVDLANVFDDENNATLIYTIQDTEADVIINETAGVISVNATNDYFGLVYVNITASDGIYNVTDSFTVNVTSVNDLPTLDNPISDITIDEDGINSSVVDLSTVFSDIETSPLTYIVNSNESEVDASETAGILSVNATNNFFGNATITIIAVDAEGANVSDSFTVTVTPINDAPIAGTIQDFSMEEDSVNNSVANLSIVFSDVDNTTLIFSSDSNETFVDSFISNGILGLNASNDFYGDVFVVVNATDGEYIAQTNFTVTITNVNDVPTVDANINDFNMDEDTTNASVVDLTTIFSDIDSSLTFNVSTNESTSNFTTSIASNILGVQALNNFYGTVEVVVSAHDGEYTVNDTFIVTVDNVNDVPVITSDSADHNIGSTNTTYTYQVVATDDDPEDVLNYSLISAPTNMTINSSTGLITWAVNDTVANYSVHINVTDGNVAWDDQSYTLQIISASAITNLVTSSSVINENLDGSNFTITATYSYDMNNSIIPNLSFSPNISTTLSCNTGSWAVDNKTLTYICTVSDANVEGITVNVSIDGGYDILARAQEAYLGTNKFSIDTVAPTVVSATATPNPTKAGAISVEVIFSENMNTSASASVNITDLSTSYPVSESAYSTNNFTGTFTLIDENEDTTATIAVINAQDAAGNALITNMNAGTFSVDTVEPNLTYVIFRSTHWPPVWATTGESAYLNFTASENITTPIVTINGASATVTYVGENNWTANRTLLVSETQGEMNFTIDFNDTIGNIGTQVTTVTTGSPLVFDNIAPNFINETATPSSPATYVEDGSYLFEITLNDTNSITTGYIVFNGVNITDGLLSSGSTLGYNATNLSVGSYNYTWYAGDVVHNNNNTEEYTYIISKSTPVLTLSVGNNLTYGESTNISCSANTNQVTPVILINGSSQGTSTYTGVLGVEYYNITCSVAATQNYTAAQSENVLVVSKAEPTLTLLLNGAANNVSTNVDTNVTINGSMDISQGSLELYIDSALYNSGLGPLVNTTSFASAGLRTVVLNYTATENYTTATTSLTINVSDNVNPSVTLVSPANNTWVTSNPVTFSYNASDVHGTVASCQLYVDSGLKLTDTTINESETNNFSKSVSGGTHTWKVKCYDDSNNNAYSSVRTVKVDTQVPITSITGVYNGFTYNSARSIKLLPDDNGDSGLNATVYRIDGGNWTNYTTTISYNSEGTHTIYYYSTDLAGNTETTKNVTFTIDTTAPTITPANPTAGENISDTFNVSGSLTGGSYTIIKIDGVVVDTINGTTTSFTSETIDSNEYSDGTHTITILTYDVAGNSNSTTISVKFDNTKPTSIITVPTSGTVTNTTITVNGTATDSTSGVQTLQLYNGTGWETVSVTSGTWSTTFDLPSEGEYFLQSKATDKAGNVELVDQTVFVTLDTTAPSISDVESSANPTLNATTISINAQVQDANGLASVIAQLNGTNATLLETTSNIYSGTITTPSNDGNYAVTIIAVDNAGNIASDSTYNLEVNTTKPAITIRPVNGTYITNVTEINISIPNKDTAWYNTSTNATQVPITTSSVAITTDAVDGAFSVYVWANTSAGASDSKTREYIVDNTDPVLIREALSSIVTSSPITVQGNVTETNMQSLKVNGVLVSLVGSNYTKSVSLSEGNNTITVLATDKAGNTATNTTVVLLDTITPETTYTLSGTQGTNGWYQGNVTVSFTVNDGMGSSGTTTQYYNGTGWTNATSKVVTSTGTVTFRSYDNAGHVENNQTTLQIKIDSADPIVNSYNISNTIPEVNDTVTFTANLSDTGSGLATIQNITIGGTTYSMVNEGNGMYTYAHVPTSLGAYQAVLTAIDKAGNTATETINFSVAIKEEEIGYDFVNDSSNVRNYNSTIDTELQITVNQTVNGNLSISKFSAAPGFVNSSLDHAPIYMDFEVSDNVNASLEWIIIKIYYDMTDLAGINESDLVMYWYNESSETWIELSASLDFVNAVGVDTTNNYVWANVTHFSTYSFTGDEVNCTAVLDDNNQTTEDCYFGNTFYDYSADDYYYCDGEMDTSECPSSDETPTGGEGGAAGDETTLEDDTTDDNATSNLDITPTSIPTNTTASANITSDNTTTDTESGLLSGNDGNNSGTSGSTDEVDSKDKKMKTWMWILLIFIILIAGAIVYVEFIHKHKEEE